MEHSDPFVKLDSENIFILKGPNTLKCCTCQVSIHKDLVLVKLPGYSSLYTHNRVCCSEDIFVSAEKKNLLQQGNAKSKHCH